MTKISIFACVLCAATLASGCAEQEKKNEAQAQAMPVNCATAPGDLRVLQSEKANTAQMIGNGVSMVFPIGLVVGVATSTEKTKYQVTTGEYNKMLDSKIAEIKAACPNATAG